VGFTADDRALSTLRNQGFSLGKKITTACNLFAGAKAPVPKNTKPKALFVLVAPFNSIQKTENRQQKADSVFRFPFSVFCMGRIKKQAIQSFFLHF